MQSSVKEMLCIINKTFGKAPRHLPLSIYAVSDQVAHNRQTNKQTDHVIACLADVLIN
jgi:hypothetical protein